MTTNSRFFTSPAVDHWSARYRRTGRTTRMLTEAIHQAKAGKAVYVIAASNSHADDLRKQLANLDSEAERLGIKIEFPVPENFSWVTFRLGMAHHNCVTFIDHYTIEKRYANILDELHRYDLPL